MVSDSTMKAGKITLTPRVVRDMKVYNNEQLNQNLSKVDT